MPCVAATPLIVRLRMARALKGTGRCCRPTDALHGADVASFQAVQQPQLPEKPQTELVSNSDDSQTVIIKMPRATDLATNLQVSSPT